MGTLIEESLVNVAADDAAIERTLLVKPSSFV